MVGRSGSIIVRSPGADCFEATRSCSIRGQLAQSRSEDQPDADDRAFGGCAARPSPKASAGISTHCGARFGLVSTRCTIEVGREMYEGYPSFKPMIDGNPVIDDATPSVSEVPAVRSPDDRRAIMTRPRFVMEDPASVALARLRTGVDPLCFDRFMRRSGRHADQGRP
jgi:hypothetical protein